MEKDKIRSEEAQAMVEAAAASKVSELLTTHYSTLYVHMDTYMYVCIALGT